MNIICCTGSILHGFTLNSYYISARDGKRLVSSSSGTAGEKMTLFGVLWLIIVLWAFLKYDMKYMFALTLLFMTFQCDNVINIGELSAGPQIVTSFAFIMKTLIGYGVKIRYNRKYRLPIFSSLLLVTIAVTSCLINEIFDEKVLFLVQLSLYVLCFICILICAGELGEEVIYRTVRGITVFLLAMGIIQILTTMDLMPFKSMVSFRSILQPLFYNDTGGASYIFFYRSRYSRIASLFQEPSYFSVFLVGAFYYFLSYTSRWKDNIILMCFMMLELLLTTSSTGYGAFLVMGILFILVNDKVKFSWKIAILAAAVLGFLFIYVGFYDLLDTVIFSKLESGSGRTRNRMNNTALAAYESSKLWGIGYKKVRGSSIIYSLLGELGICGIVAYVFFNMVIFWRVIDRKGKEMRSSEQNIGCMFALASAIVCQVLACPDLDLCSYWFWAYVSAAYVKTLTANSSIKKAEIRMYDRIEWRRIRRNEG